MLIFIFFFINNNMDSNIWGPSAWLFLHSIAYNYPDNPSYTDKINYGNFYNHIQYTLPCNLCKSGYAELLKTKPVEFSLDSKETLVQWMIDIHNEVNKKLNKPSRGYDDMILFIMNGHKKSKKFDCIYYIIIFALIVVIIFLYNNNTKWLIH